MWQRAIGQELPNLALFWVGVSSKNDMLKCKNHVLFEIFNSQNSTKI
jgi:hypothetical protein